MDIKEAFKQLLNAMGFRENLYGVSQKKINGYTLQVDLAKERIYYGELIEKGDETTSNFSQPENMVVLECVCRLLEKGYRPQDLTLEKRWHLGRSAKGGKTDILVRGEDGKTLFIVECKTWGAEFDKEQKKMFTSGGQLFSYLQQDRNAKYLCLYTSRCRADDVEYRNAIVKIEDRQEDLEAYQKGDQSIKLYQTANTVTELHDVWKERFNQYFHYNGIFEDDVNAYAIELKPLKKKDLLPFTEAERVFNRFAEILRHNNISDNANAFNRVLSLLLCKMVDEEKAGDAVLDFQVKEGEDTPEKIHDRLQNLYQRGMQQYLYEPVVYHSDEEIRGIIKKYPRQTPLENIERIFREIKYYTNNEFAFKEVHNEELFKQNARVLNEVIRMLQNYQFKHTKKQQILGDFFEMLLNHGIKQSEGQFFTPVPLVRFILLSIGLDRIADRKLAADEKRFLPKILDYACGSGHFLTESIDELQKHLEQLRGRENGKSAQDRAINAAIQRYKKSTEWAADYIYGVEKDYRLARTAQIACFINGDGEANIIFGDGLEDHERLRPAGKFDLIVANPPYSVKAFKNYLRVTGEEYSLLPHLTEQASEIEVLFLERTAKALAVGGLAGIILPSTILANTGIYARARELLLEKFEIKAVAEFGGKTFIATGTNTVILFLRRRSDDFARDRRYIAEDLFAGKPRPRQKDFIDSKKLLALFAEQKRGLPLADYKTLIAGKPVAAVRKADWYSSYRNWFDDLAETGKKKKDGIADKELNADFLDKMREQECEKFYYFMLCMGEGYEPQRLVSVNSGDTTESQKAFLGYFFSARRGSEGIRIDRDADGKYIGKLYDGDDHLNPNKAAGYILRNIWDEDIDEITETMRGNVKMVNLTDCLDFDAEKFDAPINPKPAQSVAGEWFKTRHSMTRLKDIPGIVIKKGETITKAQTAKGKIPVIAGGVAPAYYHNRSNRKGKTVTVSASGNAGYVNFYDEDIFASDCITVQVTGKGEVETDYIFLCLKAKQQKIFSLATGAIQPHVYSKDIANIKIPLPSVSVQRQITAECAKIEHNVNTAKEEATQLRAEIDKLISGASTVLSELVALSTETIQPNKEPDKSFRYVGLEHIESGTGQLTTLADVPGRTLKSAKRIFRRGDVLYGKLRPYLNKVHVAEFDGVCSTDILVLKTDSPLLVKYILMRQSFVNAATTLMQGMNLPRVQPGSLLRMKVPVPPKSRRDKVVAELAKKERRVAGCNAEIAAAQERKNAVLEKYL